MTALEIVAQKLIAKLNKAQCFDSNGHVCKKETAHGILNVPFLYIVMLDIETNTHCYANGGIAERAGIPAGWIAPGSIHSVGLIFDPMSFQRILSELDRFAQGATQPQSGVLTLISEDDPDEQVFCTDHAAVVAQGAAGDNTYYAHFFCEMNRMDLVNAHAAFDLHNLTGRQSEALSHLLQGSSYQEIAKAMDITYKTLEKHVHVVYEVTGCQNQAALIAACKTL